jgi:hypothetical protein
MGGMSLSIYMKGDYEDFHAFGRRKNKPNSKPNKAKIERNECFLLMAQEIATALWASQ